MLLHYTEAEGGGRRHDQGPSCYPTDKVPEFANSLPPLELEAFWGCITGNSQIPSDLVVKFQPVDIAELILR